MEEKWEDIEKRVEEDKQAVAFGLVCSIMFVTLFLIMFAIGIISKNYNKNKFLIQETEYKNVYEFQDKSWFILDRENEYYIFQAVELGDYDYQLNNETELKNVIKTYFMNKYNTNEEETEKEIENIFKNIK